MPRLPKCKVGDKVRLYWADTHTSPLADERSLRPKVFMTDGVFMGCGTHRVKYADKAMRVDFIILTDTVDCEQPGGHYGETCYPVGCVLRLERRKR